MSTRQGPKDPSDETKAARAVAARLDKDINPRLGNVEHQVRKLREGFAVLLQREDQKPPTGQPDWIGCRKPDQAKAILAGARAWLEDAGAVLGASLAGCWAWHPRAVVLIVAASTHYRSAYAGDSAVTLSDALTRYVPTLLKDAGTAIGDQCAGPTHLVGEALFTYDRDRLDDYAIWWATSREGLPPGLRPRVASVG